MSTNPYERIGREESGEFHLIAFVVALVVSAVIHAVLVYFAGGRKITFAGDKATARFRQNYTSATLKSSTSKTLTFVKSDNKWLIQQERVG